MTLKLSIRCQYCRYWKLVESTGDTPYMRTCHRYPPQIYVWGGKRMHEQPKTHPASWCGEFKPRKLRAISPGKGRNCLERP